MKLLLTILDCIAIMGCLFLMILASWITLWHCFMLLQSLFELATADQRILWPSLFCILWCIINRKRLKSV